MYCPAGVEVSAAFAFIILSFIILSIKSGVSSCLRFLALFALSLSSNSWEKISREEVLPESLAVEAILELAA